MDSALTASTEMTQARGIGFPRGLAGAIAAAVLLMLAAILPATHAHATLAERLGETGLAQDAAGVVLAATSSSGKKKKCPAGQNPDPKTGVCFSCSHNDHFESGKCVPCKSGFHEEVQLDENGDEQRVCAPDKGKKKAKAKAKAKKCAKGLEVRDGKCRKPKSPEIDQCPEGQNMDPQSGVCFSCSHNDHFENGKCVPCKQGFHVEGDQCVAD